ncbi:MAG: hypothetical protein R3Y28_01045 [Candidatus Gastranaerophilales bacterium]
MKSNIEQIEELACKFNVLNDCINLLTDCLTNQYFSKNNLKITSLLFVIKDYSAYLSKSLNDFHQSCENEIIKLV